MEIKGSDVCSMIRFVSQLSFSKFPKITNIKIQRIFFYKNSHHKTVSIIRSIAIKLSRLKFIGYEGGTGEVAIFIKKVYIQFERKISENIKKQ